MAGDGLRAVCDTCGITRRVATACDQYTCNDCRRLASVPEPTDADGLPPGQWVTGPGGVQRYVLDVELDEAGLLVPPGVCVTCGGGTHKHRRECGACVSYRQAMLVRREAEALLEELTRPRKSFREGVA